MDELALALPIDHVASLTSGLTVRPDLDLLDALGTATWLALPPAIAEDPLAVLVELAPLLVRGDHWWFAADGRLVVPAPVRVDELAQGLGLGALRTAAARRVGGQRGELAGLIFDPGRLGRRLILVYRIRIDADPVGPGSWMSPTSAKGLALDPLSRLVIDGLRP